MSPPTLDALPSPELRVLFLNTRSALGADVAVHLTLIRNFDPCKVEAHVATNSNAVDVEQTLAQLRDVPGLHPLVMDLGHEVSGGGRGKVARGVSALSNLSALPSLARLARYVRQHRIQLIHTTDRPRDALFATLLARMTGCRAVIHVHNKWDAGMGRATNFAVQHCAAILAISQFARSSMLDAGLLDAKIYTCLNATDVAWFDPARTQGGVLRDRLGLGPNVPLIGIVARIMLWKGHLELVEALAKVKLAVPDVHLAIIGKSAGMIMENGESFETLVRQRITAAGLTDSVHWAGWHDDMPAIMADLDVLAVPSWEEPFGLVVTEGMAMQRPIVGFAAGALSEIFTNGVEGLLVPPRDTNALADALITLLRDPSLRAAMGHKGRERIVAEFTPRRQADEMTEIYKKIVAR